MSRSGKRAARRGVEVAPRSEPAPRRGWWWLKPVRRVVLIALLGAIAGHGWWAWSTERALDGQIRAYAVAGEVIYPAALNDDDRAVADADNAVIELRAAGRLLKDSAAEWITFAQVNPGALPLSKPAMAIVANLLANNREAMARLEAATAKPAANWGINFRSPVIEARPAEMVSAFHLANLLRSAALYAQQCGDEAAALRRVGQMLALARIVDRQGLYPAHLAATSIAASAARTACEIARNPPRLGSAARENVRRLIDDFLHEQWLIDGQARALRTFRVTLWDTAKAVAGGRADLLSIEGGVPIGTGRLGGYAAKPLLMTDALAMVRYVSATTEAARRSSDWPTFVGNAPPEPMEPALHPRLHFLAVALMPDLKRYICGQYRAVTECRLAALALAAAAYAREHDAASPAALDQLVGLYLPYVPFDPMAAGERPLRLGERADGAVVYSVGDDGVDDGGSEVVPVTDPAAVRAARDWERRDFVVRLRR